MFAIGEVEILDFDIDGAGERNGTVGKVGGGAGAGGGADGTTGAGAAAGELVAEPHKAAGGNINVGDDVAVLVEMLDGVAAVIDVDAQKLLEGS